MPERYLVFYWIPSEAMWELWIDTQDQELASREYHRCIATEGIDAMLTQVLQATWGSEGR